MLELRNVLNIKEFSRKLRSKKAGKTKFKPPLRKNSVWKKFWDVLFSETKRRPPPPTVAKIFRKNFRFPEKLFGRSPGMGGGPNFFNSRPQPDTTWHGPANQFPRGLCFFLRQIFQNGSNFLSNLPYMRGFTECEPATLTTLAKYLIQTYFFSK
jgi:hypothetical protein